MNELLAKAGGVFLTPAPAAPVLQRAPAPPPDLVGVLAPPRDLAALAGGVAAGLRRRHHARAALVCAALPAVAAGPATRAARSLVTRLADRELRATAGGALCRLALPDDPDDGVRDAWRAIAAAAGSPAVVALPARSDAFDALLAQADLLLVAEPGHGAYAELALASLTALGPPAALIRAPAAFLARRAAAYGLTAITPVPEAAPA